MESTTVQSDNPNDIVLKSARGILTFTKWLLMLGAVVVTVAIPVLPFFSADIVEGVAEVFVTPPGNAFVWSVVGMLMFALIMILLSMFAVSRLRRIVDSVAEGNPFTRINGTRLRGMGIAAFAMQVVTFFGSALATAMMSMLGEVKPGQEFDITIDGGISLTGILLVLLLIILARIFDRGAEMQEELEGTV